MDYSIACWHADGSDPVTRRKDPWKSEVLEWDGNGIGDWPYMTNRGVNQQFFFLSHHRRENITVGTDTDSFEDLVIKASGKYFLITPTFSMK